MNAAFVLVTTALLAGQNAPSNNGASANDNKPAATATAPAAPATTGGCCGDTGAWGGGGCCDSGFGGGGGHGLFSRFRGGHGGGSCGCQGGSAGFGSRFGHGGGGDCGCGSGGGFLSGLRGRLGRHGHRGDCGCDSGGYNAGYNGCCNGGTFGVGGTYAAPGGKAEQLQTAPKEDAAPGNKMPKGDKGDADKNVRAEPPTGQIRTQIPAAPALETTPAIVPNVPANNQEQRDPPF